jgi:ribosome biogenesis GTPase
MDTHSTLTNTQGIVISKTTGSYGVQPLSSSPSAGPRVRDSSPPPAGEGPGVRESCLHCALSSRLRPEQVVVGDVVRFVAGQGAPGPGTTGLVVEVLPRRNQLARRGVASRPGAHAPQQVIAANVDQVVPVFAATSPAPKWNLLDRYLALAESLELPALVIITKADLAPTHGEDEFQEALAEYRRLGYQVILTSAHTGAGLDALRDAFRGRVSVLLGKSGVGKTSLLNALEPGLGLRVSEVSRATGKGRHTTNQVQMVPLTGETSIAQGQPAAIIDTPGTREFGLWDIDGDELALFFREMRPLVGRCKFGLDCRHDEEPGCAIHQAVMAGHISPRRYKSYQRLRAEA